MADRVNSDEIEALVGAERHMFEHIVRLDDNTQTIYVLHSFDCIEEEDDLTECIYSVAIDNHRNWLDNWAGWHNVPVLADVTFDARLLPIERVE